MEAHLLNKSKRSINFMQLNDSCYTFRVTYFDDETILGISLHLVNYSNENAWRRKFVNGVPDSKVHGANMGPNWGRQDPGGPHDGPMNP